MAAIKTTSKLASLLIPLLLALAAALAAGGAEPRLPPPLRVSPRFDANATIAASITLPAGSKPKSFAFGNGTDLFVCTLSGNVLHLDAAAPTAAAPTLLAAEPGIALAGIQYDAAQHALFVAGTVSGKIFVYFLTPARPYSVARRAAVALARPRGRLQAPYVNDVLLAHDFVYATDSFEPYLHAIPRVSPTNWGAAAAGPGTPPGESGATYMRLGPAFVTSAARLNANGLAMLRPGLLLVSNFDQSYVAAAELPPGGGPKAAGEQLPTAVIARLPQVRAGGKGPINKVWADVMVVGEAPDVVYLSDNFQDRVLRLQLAPDASSANVTCVISPRKSPGGPPAVRAPTAMAFRDGLLWVLNARLLDCPFVLPCKGQGYEIVAARPADACAS